MKIFIFVIIFNHHLYSPQAIVVEMLRILLDVIVVVVEIKFIFEKKENFILEIKIKRRNKRTA
jgi:hypothetical protein